MTSPTNSLKEILDEKKAAFNAVADEKIKSIYAEGIEDVANGGVLENAKNVGDTAPPFELTNAVGTSVSLQAYLEKGPVVLTWYRGGWCPYCNLTLQRLQNDLPDFQAEGANLLALTPEKPDKSISTQEKYDLKFEVLSDVGNAIAKAYGIVFKLTDAVAASYKNNFDLEEFNGDDTKELPLAATYVIDRNGIIQFAFLDAEYRNRAEPAEIIKVLQKLK